MDSDNSIIGPEAGADVIEARRMSFGATASTYDAVRPPWPAETIEWLLGSPGRGTSLQVLDLGAGTGLGTRTIAGLGHHVVAVDPSDRMLASLKSAMGGLSAEQSARIITRLEPAEQLSAATNSVDAVTCLQAWHWVDEDKAAAECARILHPGGWIGLAWHIWDGSAAWVEELSDIVGQPEMARRQTDAIPPKRSLDGFSVLENRQVPFTHELTVEQLVQLASSWSFVAVRSDREEVLETIRSLGGRVASPNTGTLSFPNVTDCYRAQRLGS